MAQPQAVLGQSGPQVPSAQPIAKTPDPVDQEQFLPYWTTETGWDTELQLRNNLAGQTLLVTPSLRTADGTETGLAAVTLQPHEVQSIDLNAAIGSSTPQLVGTYGSVVLRYHSVGLRNLYAALMLRTVGHPIAFHVDATGQIQNYEAASREGIWWLPNDSISDYLILNNQGANTIRLDLSLLDSAGKAFTQKVSLGPRQTSRLSVRKLVQLGGLIGTFGGIKISTAAHAGSIDSLHFLFDTQVGFSGLLKMFDHDPNTIITERDNAKTGVWTLRAPMLALTQPDPALAFPDGTTLQPQLFIRNTTSKPLTAALRFNWRGDSVTGKAQGPTLQLLPYETRRVDIAALQDGKILPTDARWTSVTLTTNGKPDEVMAVAASYDATLQHGAQTPFSDQLAFAWEGGMWEYNAQHNSIMTAGNGGTKPTHAALTLFYNRGTERYDLEQTLQPDEQMWIDIGKLIREHVPDKNGKILPADLSSGSYEFRDLNDKLGGTLFEGKVVYEKTYGHVTYGCMICCDELPPWLSFNPLGIIYTGNAPNGVNSEDCNGTTLDISSRFDGNWTTANHAIATVGFDGTHTGVAVGSTTSSTFGPVMTQHGRICYNTQKNAGGGDNVATLSCTPSSITRGGSVTCSVNGAPTGATFSNWKFTDSNNNTATSTQTTSSWSGTIVTSGTVSVQVSASGSNSTTPSASITVNNRSGSGWTFSPASATSENNGFICPPSGPTLLIPSPPSASFSEDGTTTGDLGMYCNTDGSSFNTAALNDGGPNNGYKYVTSISPGTSNQPWAYYYVISPDLQNSSSTFSLAQCGNYNTQTNPNGFISQPNLLTNTTRHESGSNASHYAQYVAAVNASANNPGTVAEQQVGAPGLSLSQFGTNVTNALNSANTNINSATKSPEPYGPNNAANGTFQGYTNFYPYASCQ
jgi:hypothetical protein